MARLRLRTRIHTEELTYPATGEVVLLPTFRLHVSLHFVSPTLAQDWRPTGQIDQLRRFDAIVDTGAMLTNIPYEIWEPFAHEIQWPSTTPGQNTIRIAGSSLSYQLGRVMIAALDNENRWMSPVWTVARCWHYCEDAPPPLLGLTSAFMTNNRRLRHDGSTDSNPDQRPPVWWLEDSHWW